jgi:hypothetical protein
MKKIFFEFVLQENNCFRTSAILLTLVGHLDFIQRRCTYSLGWQFPLLVLNTEVKGSSKGPYWRLTRLAGG